MGEIVYTIAKCPPPMPFIRNDLNILVVSYMFYVKEVFTRSFIRY